MQEQQTANIQGQIVINFNERGVEDIAIKGKIPGRTIWKLDRLIKTEYRKYIYAIQRDKNEIFKERVRREAAEKAAEEKAALEAIKAEAEEADIMQTVAEPQAIAASIVNRAEPEDFIEEEQANEPKESEIEDDRSGIDGTTEGSEDSTESTEDTE